MALSSRTLGDVIGLNIKKGHCINCLAIIKKEKRQCTNPVAQDKCNNAHEILQYRVTFQNDEEAHIKEKFKVLAKLLVHDKHGEAEKQKFEQKWLQKWLTQAEEHRQKREKSQALVKHQVSCISPEVAELSEDEPFEDELLDSTPSTPAITYRSPLLLEGTPSITYPTPRLLQDAPAPESTEKRLLPVPPMPRQILNCPKASNDEIVKKDDASVGLKEASTTPETSALGVFMSPSQRMIFQAIVQTVSQFVFAARMQFSSTPCTSDAGHVEKQSAFELDMLLRVRIPMPGLLNSVYIILALQVATSQVIQTSIGINSTQALIFVFLGWFIMWWWKPTQTPTRSIQA